MPQEGIMVVGKGMLGDDSLFGLLGWKRRAGRTKTPLERILEDFPWLWAVNQCWAGNYVPSVTQDMQPLRQCLWLPSIALRENGLWLAFANELSAIWNVERIESHNPDISWAEEALLEIGLGLKPLYAATCFEGRITVY